jgi:hypothetical protein
LDDKKNLVRHFLTTSNSLRCVLALNSHNITEEKKKRMKRPNNLVKVSSEYTDVAVHRKLVLVYANVVKS